MANLRSLRAHARDEINRLLEFLDASDPYVVTELEDDISAEIEEGGDTEPSLGSFDRMTNQDRSYRQVSLWAFPPVDGEKDDADDEPSLGSCDSSMSGGDQTHWASSGRDDSERDESDTGIAIMTACWSRSGSGT